MSFTSRTRALIACCALAFCFTGFSARLVQLQVAMHDEYAAQAAENHGLKQTIYARRGLIQDVHGLPLAQNEPVCNVVVDASVIKDRPMMARLLSGPLQMSESVLLTKMAREHQLPNQDRKVPCPWIVLKNEVREPVVAAIDQAIAQEEEELAKQSRSKSKPRIRGVIYEPSSVRIYPNADLLCHVVGFVDRKGVGQDGVEKQLDSFLTGHNGFRYIERDSTGKELVPYRGLEMPARDGCNVRITIDSEIQMIVESELEEAMKQYHPKMGVSIFMRPQTGEILAMANRPSYNLNQQNDVPDQARINSAVMAMIEPGSTFKIVTTAAALAQKLVTPDTVIFCENARFTYGGSTLHDHRPYGDLTVHDILVKSSNIGVAKLGIQLGDQKLYEYVRRFGFGERTDIALPGEIGGMVHPPHKWSKISITHVPMGQEVGVTPLQIVSAMSAIANGGTLMMPLIIHDITDTAGNTVATYPPTEVRRVIPEQTAKQIRAALTDVVSKRGTAQLAHVDGFKVAGKTGTAQKAGPHGGYEHGKYVVSFVGFMPADHPEIAGIVMLDDPTAKSDQLYGGIIAAPVFSKIAARVARYMNLQPTETETAEKPGAEKSEHEPD